MGRIRDWWDRYRHIKAAVDLVTGLLRWVGWWNAVMVSITSVVTFLSAHFLRLSAPVQFLALLSSAVLFLLILLLAVKLKKAAAAPLTAKEIRNGSVIVDAHGKEYVRPASTLLLKTISAGITIAALIILFTVFFPRDDTPPDMIKMLADLRLNLIPSPADQVPFVSAALVPPVWEWDKQQPVTGLLISIDNNGPVKQRQVSAHLSLPWIKEAHCHNPERVHIIGGGQRWTGYIDLLAEELVPSERQVCEVNLLRPVSFTTVTAWKQHYYAHEASAESRGTFEIYLYRVAQGKEEQSGNPEHPFRRRLTLMVN